MEVSEMNRADAIPLRVNIPTDVREHLQAWAAHNVTSMTAELVRSVRDRAEREQAERREQVR
jgi:hypothetical protein